MAKRARAYRGEKRRKELSRQKKQEKKRQRRIDKGIRTQQDTDKIDVEDEHTEQED